MSEEQDIWFSGPISDAISIVNQRNCVLLVYIHDDSEKAQTLNATLKDEHVIATIKENAVALSMEKNSENATLFGQFYPIQAVPIVYFIKQGTIRDFGIETITSEEIVEKIIQLNEFVTPQPSPVNSQLPGQPTPQSHVVDTPSISVDSAPTTVPSVNTTTTPSIPPVAPSSSDTQEAKAKKEELQKQIEKVRKERAERDKQDAKEREIKRRQEAKLLQEAKQDRVDKENKKYFEQIKKERLEDEAHRKKVRDQIAKDRAEKIASRNAEKQRSSPEINAVPSNIEHANTINLNHNYSNLNIRQLDGTNLRNKFEASDTLSTVREWINQNRTDDKRKTFKLSSQFPTRLFTEQDDGTTLTNLNLCPSATIIMKPLKPSRTSNNQVGMISYTFNTIYGFFFAFIKLITGIFATLFPTNQQQIQPQHQQQQQQQQQQPLFRNLKGGQRLGGESSSTPPVVEPTVKKRNPYATRVNTLEEEDDEDEKRSTYNGNSVNHE